MKLILTVLAAVAMPYPVMAQAVAASLTPSYTTPTNRTSQYRPTQIAMTAVGFLLLSGLLDQEIHTGSQQWRGEVSDQVARVSKEMGNGKLLLPVFGVAYLSGKAMGSERLADAAGHTIQAGIAAGLVVTGVKFLTGRSRPNSGSDGDDFDLFRSGDTAFPSGHTAIAFSVAGALSNEIPGSWDDVGLYGIATATGLGRINDNKHWLTDVVAGAAVGILAGRWATRSHRGAAPMMVSPNGIGLSFDF